MGERGRRATQTRLQGRDRSRYLAERIGRALRDARIGSGRRQADVAQRAGISQSFYSRIERGAGAGSSLHVLAACALACNAQLAAFIEALPGASLPNDIEHLRRQQAVIELAARGGWHAAPERGIDPDARRSRSIDVMLERAINREIAVVEIVDLITDAGATFRGHADKVSAIRREFGARWRIAGLLVIRGTHRNRDLIRSVGAVMRTRYPGASHGWLASLGDPNAAMPNEDGFAWTGARTPELRPARLR